ncbi:MAG: SAM-dependent chlorinase/fluorinase [Chitinophagales bacterium]|nr:SAM-dependent chlorinase/fluorinase [Chitinophagales bacterium]
MPLLTLSTDIGQQDFIVGAVKGQLLSAIPNLTIADITHYLPRENFAHAAYICKNAFAYYPENTFHIILLNVFDTPSTHFVLSKYKNQFIICPNNGIITMMAGEIPKDSIVLPIINAHTLIQITEQLTNVIQKLIKTNSIENLGTTGLVIEEKYMMKPIVSDNWMQAQILFIDNFENAVVNVSFEEFERERKGRNFKIVFKRNETVSMISKNYADVTEGQYLAWFNSAGYLEVAVNKGKAAELFGLENYKDKMLESGIAPENKLFYTTVRIFFE